MSGDLREAIGEVMKEIHGSGLAKIGMWDYLDEKFKPLSSYSLQFDSQQNQLEPIYYWVLDFAAQVGWTKMEKITDNFTASPGSGQFSEMNMKATKMQEEAMKILGGMNQIIKSILNLIYDLKEFELRLSHYDDAASSDKVKKKDGLLALKQIWLDNVDIKRGRGSIHQMASMEMGFSTLREAFMIADSVEDLDKMNSDDKKKGGSGLINDSVMRILRPRVNEFLKWVDYSEKELRKRFDIERNYLKSQVESVKLYSQWMKPYLVAAEKLRQQGFDNHAALVNAFSTTMFELQLMGTKSVGAPISERRDIKGDKKYEAKRGYNQVIIITMKYRGHVSQRVTQKGDYGFGMGGVVDIDWNCYALNDEELAAAKKKMADEDLEKSMSFSLDVAEDALKTLKDDLDYFLKSKEERDKEDEKKKKDEKKEDLDINPFGVIFEGIWSLFGGGKKKKKKGKEKEKEFVEVENIKKDNFYERKMRAKAIDDVTSIMYTMYDVFKKAHRMASAPAEGFDKHDADSDSLAQGGKVGFFDAFRKE